MINSMFWFKYTETFFSTAQFRLELATVHNNRYPPYSQPGIPFMWSTRGTITENVCSKSENEHGIFIKQTNTSVQISRIQLQTCHHIIF